MRIAILLTTLMYAITSAQPKQRIAIIPSTGEYDVQNLTLLAAKVEEIAVRILPHDNFIIIKQDEVKKKLGGDSTLYERCREGTCVADIAKEINANYGARCSVFRIEGELVLQFELYSENNSPIETFIEPNAKDFRKMLTVLEERLPYAFGKMLTLSSRATSPTIQDNISDLEKAVDNAMNYDQNYIANSNTKQQGTTKIANSRTEPKSTTKKSVVSLGFRAGINFSHIYESIHSSSGSSDNKTGFHVGLMFDLAASDWFHIQMPSIMYIQKGAEYKGYNEVLHFFEILPVSVSLKFSAFRLNVGPYIGVGFNWDLGFNYGFGFDIGDFYIGMFYEHGLMALSHSKGKEDFDRYSRTLAFTLGYNI